MSKVFDLTGAHAEATSDPAIDAAAEPLAHKTTLDDLRSELSAQIRAHNQKGTRTFEVEARPGYAVRVSADIDHEMAQRWVRKAADVDFPDGTNDVLLSCIQIASQTEAIIKDGADLVDAGGKKVTFGHPFMLEVTGANGPTDAIRAFWGDDQDLLLTASALQRAAGYDRGQKIAIEDPDFTRR